MGSGTHPLFRPGAGPYRFNPFQGFMGSGTRMVKLAADMAGLFQSLPGIYGVWHLLVPSSRMKARSCFNPFQGFMGSGTANNLLQQPSILQFQSLPGIYGVWHIKYRIKSSGGFLVSIPSRDLWGLARPGGPAKGVPQSRFNPFQGFMGSGTSHICQVYRGIGIGFNPFQGFMGSGTENTEVE